MEGPIPQPESPPQAEIARLGKRIAVDSVPTEHRSTAPQSLRCAVLTISDTRTLDDDAGGAVACEHLVAAGHLLVARSVCRDEPAQIRDQILRWQAEPNPDAILLTGGTGISLRDQTYETLQDLMTRQLPGYGELFRWLSYQEIGPAAMLSRALGGLVGPTVVLSMPGSPQAVRLAMQRLILPELGHLVQQARR